MRVHVTQADINRGEPIQIFKCPVARAIRRALGGRVHVFVTGTWGIEGRDGDQRVIAPLPDRVLAFIRRFDSLGGVADDFAPFSFTTRRPR